LTRLKLGFWDTCDTFNLNISTQWQLLHANTSTRRHRLGECCRINFINSSEIAHAREVDVALHNVFQASPTRFQYGPEIGKNLFKVSYQTLTPKMVPKAVDCIAVSFANKSDPFTKALGLTQAQWGVMAQMFVQRAADKDLSFVAVNENDGQIVGVTINEDWKEKQPDVYRSLVDWAPVRAIFNELHTRYKAQQAFITHGKVLHPLYFTCVRPEARRLGIVSKLWEQSVELARSRNYEQMVAEASNPSSESVFQKLGFTESSFVKFADFKFQGETPFAGMEKDGFTKLTMYQRPIPSNLY